ncbi:cytochrome P450 [Pseudonocardia sp. GCM10023141]|uniref:cytochrome P450 n=1 Tax=Pseudonocardia sp. GCM10023141 TaxID=3252653 RepID=UPI00362251FA
MNDSVSVAPDMASPEFVEDPYAAYTVYREKYPLLWHEGMQSYIISRYVDVELALKDPRFSTRNYAWQLEPLHGRTIVQMDGREHSTRRSLVQPAFRGRDLTEKFVPVIERNAAELIAGFAGDGHADLVAQFANLLPINVIIDMLGLPRQDYAKFQDWYATIIAFLSNLNGDPDVAAAGLSVKQEIADYLIPVIEARQADPGDDLLSVLCTAEIDGFRMTSEEVKGFVSLLLAAGGETTDKAIGSLMHNLLTHPDQLAAVQADRSLVDAAFAETLRHSPMTQMVMREPTEDVEVSGGTIPAGSTVTCLIGAANRDTERFAAPDEFNLFRSDLDATRAFTAAAGHVGFGLGRHFCVGSFLAKAEVTIGVNALLDMAPDLRSAPDAATVDVGLFTRGPDRVLVEFTAAGDRAEAGQPA